MSERLAKATLIEGVATVEEPDSAKEILVLKGADTSALNNGFLNVDHKKTMGSVVGRILDHKKIFRKEDCETPKQLEKWEKLQKPFLYIRGELWGAPPGRGKSYGHKEADSIAAIYQYYTEKGEEAPLKLSVEGKILERQGKKLTQTCVKGAAITLAPCVKSTSTEVVDFLKSQNVQQDAIDSLMKSSHDDSQPFYEIQDDPMQRITTLIATARHLLKIAADIK